jgi:ketosteroid isomerase-like protein
VSLVRAAFEAQAAGDLEPTRALSGDDGVVHVPEFIPLQNLRGFDGLVTLLATMMERCDGGFDSRFLEAVGDGDIVTTVNKVTATRDGRTLSYNTVWTFRFEGGKVAEAWLHPSLPAHEVAEFYGF